MQRRQILPALAVVGLTLLPSLGSWGQAIPRIAALYPAGARRGSTVEVAIRGGGLEGAHTLLIDGAGVTASFAGDAIKIDPGQQRVFAAKCALCHDLRGPASLSRTPDQWLQTVDRMIRDRQAPIEAGERQQIVAYLQAAARASTGLSAKLTIASDAAPGVRELRVVGANGVSGVYKFTISDEPEVLEVEPNDVREKPQSVSLPALVNGQVGAGDADHYEFTARKGERVIMNCSAYRLNEASQGYFFPALYLFDATGRELARNSGYFSLDPLIDFTAPADGKYVVQVRDLLYRGSPAAVYRLSLGALPYRARLFPPGGRSGETVQVELSAEGMAPRSVSVPLKAGMPVGLQSVPTPVGPLPFVVGDAPEAEDQSAVSAAVAVPASINGRLDSSPEDRLRLSVGADGLGPMSIELYAERIGSPIVARLTLRDSQGRVIGQTNPGQLPGARDPRLDVNIPRAGDYTLEVTDADGRTGPDRIYRAVIGAGRPEFTLAISPDAVNVAPGGSVYLPVQVLRRSGGINSLRVELRGLPAGVRAYSSPIFSDQNQGFLVLTADAGTTATAAAVVTPMAIADVAGGPVERAMQPVDVYLIGNNRMATFRRTMAVSVGAAPEWRFQVTAPATKLGAATGPITVTIQLERPSTSRDLAFQIVGLPNGVRAPQSVLLRRGAKEVSFQVFPSNQGVFAAQGTPGPRPDFFMLTVINGREAEAMQKAAEPLRIDLVRP